MAISVGLLFCVYFPALLFDTGTFSHSLTVPHRRAMTTMTMMVIMLRMLIEKPNHKCSPPPHNPSRCGRFSCFFPPYCFPVFNSSFPARTCYGGVKLPLGAAVEIEAIALTGSVVHISE